MRSGEYRQTLQSSSPPRSLYGLRIIDRHKPEYSIADELVVMSVGVF